MQAFFVCSCIMFIFSIDRTWNQKKSTELNKLSELGQSKAHSQMSSYTTYIHIHINIHIHIHTCFLVFACSITHKYISLSIALKKRITSNGGYRREEKSRKHWPLSNFFHLLSKSKKNRNELAELKYKQLCSLTCFLVFACSDIDQNINSSIAFKSKKKNGAK